MTEKNADTMVIAKTVDTINVVIVRNLVAIGVSTRDCGEEKSMKRQDIYRGLKSRLLDDFEHYCTCWANRRNQWSKAKKADKRIAKKRERRRWRKEHEQDD